MPRAGGVNALHARGRQLKELLIEKRTLSKYNLATQRFLQWLGTVGFAVASSHDQLDFQRSEYLFFYGKWGKGIIWLVKRCQALAIIPMPNGNCRILGGFLAP